MREIHPLGDARVHLYPQEVSVLIVIQHGGRRDLIGAGDGSVGYLCEGEVERVGVRIVAHPQTTTPFKDEGWNIPKDILARLVIQGQEIIRLSHSGLDSKTFRIESVKRLRKAIPTDVSFFATADPATLLFTSTVRDEVLAQATPQFLEREFLQDDPVEFARLARGRSPVESLGMATKGELALSARYREMLAPMDLGDELRAALVVGSKCWGFMCLHRERSGPDFTPGEAAFLARLVPHLAEGLRKALLLGGPRTASPQPEG